MSHFRASKSVAMREGDKEKEGALPGVACLFAWPLAGWAARGSTIYVENTRRDGAVEGGCKIRK
jgi:hypothetical protein